MAKRVTTKQIRRFAEQFRVDRPERFDLDDVDCGYTAGIRSKVRAASLMQQGVERLADLQERLWAQNRRSLLLIFQAMDAAGKDSTIKHVMSGLNPQGCQVWPFKAPSEEELDHDFLWRHAVRLPERGRIGIHNRSWYEETLVVRVHQELLDNERLPSDLVTKNIWDERFESIIDFERHLARNGTVIRKFFLHVSKEEQRKRLLQRLKDPSKNWKFSARDVDERERWGQYMKVYEQCVRATSTKHAPWYVMPADHKWFLRLAVAAVVIDALEGMDLAYPEPTDEQRTAFATARKVLIKDGKKS
jgi:PPK2 family polyphosphate:nucleotide phosphotransferase